MVLKTLSTQKNLTTPQNPIQASCPISLFTQLPLIIKDEIFESFDLPFLSEVHHKSQLYKQIREGISAIRSQGKFEEFANLTRKKFVEIFTINQ